MRLVSLFYLVFTCALVLFHGTRVAAFDTGHHNDLTRNALENLGYNDNAQKVAAFCNFMVDYFAYTLDFEDIDEVRSLHFDNLYTLQNVSNYLAQLTINGRSAARNASSQNDVVQYLCLLGASLHAVQDFYTHSSWVELHQGTCDCFRDDTWFTALNQTDGNVTLLLDQLVALKTYSWGETCGTYEHNCFPGTLPHGDYCIGINKDSYVRPYWENAYSFAFVGSIEWIWNFQKWATEVNANIVQQAMQYTPTAAELEDLNEDTENMIKIAYSTKTVFEDDGHWKGPGSGDYARFATSGADFITDSSIYKEQFTERMVYKALTDPPLYLASPNVSDAITLITPYFDLPANLQNWTAVIVRTDTIDIEDDIFDTPSPYAVVTIGNLPFEEGVQIDRINFRPHWTSIKFVSSATTNISINYTLFDDEFASDDDLVSIAPGDGHLNLTLSLPGNQISGDANGVFDSPQRTLTTANDDNRVSIFIYSKPLGSCDLDFAFPQPFCPNVAYVQNGLHEYCEDRGEKKRSVERAH